MKTHRLFSDRTLTRDVLLRSLEKAATSGARNLWCDLKTWRQVQTLISTEQRLKFFWIVELDIPSCRNGEAAHAPSADQWVLVSNGKDLKAIDLEQLLAGLDKKAHLLIRPTNRLKANELLPHWPELTRDRTWFEFLPWRPDQPQRFTVPEIRRFMRDIYRLDSGRKLISPPGLEIWDDRQDPLLEVEPLIKPDFERQAFHQQPKISCIIPTFNNKLFVQSVVLALLKQNLPREQFEIIVVDDGSTDGTRECLRKLVFPEWDRVNFSLYFMPRPSRRSTGDNHYRAGIARNLGAKYARGERLQFLDSDILVAPGFLQRMLEHAEQYDVIQCERHHIFPKYCTKTVTYEEIEIERQTYIEDASYWKPFFKTKNWSAIEKFWKYTCTYCLMVRKSDFDKVGRFKRTFTTYGFEDVDLGYELARMGLRFSLLHEKTLHLTPHRSRSEYSHSQWVRHQLLSRSAKTFFRQHLDPEIHDLFPSFMAESAWWQRWRQKLRTKSGSGSE